MMAMSKAETTWIHAPRQARSQDTTDRILQAVGRLIETRDLDQVSVTDIARAAQISIGGFYARFPGKAAVLHALDEYILGLAATEVRRKMAADKLEGLPIQDVVQTYIRLAVGFFSKHRVMIRQIYLKSRSSGDAAYVARTQAFNEKAHGQLRDRLLERAAAITHPDPEAACTFAVMMVSATMRESILFSDRKMNLSTLAGRELCSELTRAFCNYLGATYAD